MSNELLELKNIGKTSAQWLNAVGIRTIDQLRTTGSVASYCKIRDRGFKVSKVLLYALAGALNDAHWSELTNDQKNSLLQEVDKISNSDNL